MLKPTLMILLRSAPDPQSQSVQVTPMVVISSQLHTRLYTDNTTSLAADI